MDKTYFYLYKFCTSGSVSSKDAICSRVFAFDLIFGISIYLSGLYDAYGSEFSKRDFRLQNRSFMVALKGFSSPTPFFYPALREISQCAYERRRNFLDNAIFVTHNHIDHNGDLPAIEDFCVRFIKAIAEIICRLKIISI